jgi:hypothetical protein
LNLLNLDIKEIIEKALPGHFLPDHRLTDVPGFASTAPGC